MTNPIVVDISHWQPNVDFKAMKAAGTVGVILKATEGTTTVDKTFKERQKQAKDAGLCVATYHFLKKGSIAQQMQFYVKTVQPATGDRMVIDYEDGSLFISDLETAIDALRAAAPGVEVTVYGANGFLGYQLNGKKNDKLASCSLWVASYTTKSEPTMTDLKGTWPVWSLWQYTDKALIEGVPTGVDANRWNGSPDSLPGWFHKGDVAPTPVPTPSTDPVTIEVTAPDGVEVKVLVNGKRVV